MIIRTMTATAAAFVAATSLSACATTAPSAKETTMSTSPTPRDVEAELRALPSYESAQREYLAAVTETANAITALVPGLTWKVEEERWIGCGGDYVDTPARHAYVFASFNGAIPEPVWPRALDIVTQMAKRLNIENVDTPRGEPGDHDVVFTGTGGEVEFGTAKAGILSAMSDCRLPENPTPPTP